MRCLTLRERGSVRVGPGLKLSDAEAEEITHVAERLPKRVLTRGYRKMQFRPFCGVLGTQNVAIELLPKIDQVAQDDDNARGLLVDMLVKAGRLRRLRAGETDLRHQDRHLLDVFIEDFCAQVREALLGGAIATYRENQENLRAIRGRIALTEHLRVNIHDQSRVLCRFDERSVDNPHNSALKAVLRKILGRALGQNARSAVTALLHRFDEASDRLVTAGEIRSLPFDRVTERWKPVFDQATMLMEGLFPDVRIGDAAGSPLLFDMEKLFEDILGRCVRQTCWRLAKGRLSVHLQGPPRHLAKSAFGMRPDIAIEDSGNIVAILDAKWKALDHDAAAHGVSNPDAYQMNAYAGRYFCDHVALVYPATGSVPPGKVRSFTLQTGNRPTLDVIAVDVKRLALHGEVGEELEELISQQASVPVAA